MVKTADLAQPERRSPMTKLSPEGPKRRKSSRICAVFRHSKHLQPTSMDNPVDLTVEPPIPKHPKSGYVASSLVWGKVRRGVWWPGQVFDPADSSREALRRKEDGKFLVAYFGDEAFGWNDVKQLKPFQMDFEKMVSRSDLEKFCSAVDCALDEVFRRVVFGLSCTCLSENIYSDIGFQIVENSGVHKSIRRRDVGDECSSLECFVPSKLVSYIKEAAIFFGGFVDKLELVKCKAQLTSFCRWKEYCEPPEFIGLPENNATITNIDGRDFHVAVAMNAEGGLQLKRRGRPKGSLNVKTKKKKMSDGMDDNELCIIPQNHVKTEIKGELQFKRRGRRPKGNLLNAKRKAKEHMVSGDSSVAASPKKSIGISIPKSK